MIGGWRSRRGRWGLRLRAFDFSLGSGRDIRNRLNGEACEEGMNFLIWRGTAKWIEGEGAVVHGYICVAHEEDLTRALEKANQIAKEVGFVLHTVDDDPMIVAYWRALLPTEQGRELRDARRLGAVLTLTATAVADEL